MFNIYKFNTRCRLEYPLIDRFYKCDISNTLKIMRVYVYNSYNFIILHKKNISNNKIDKQFIENIFYKIRKNN